MINKKTFLDSLFIVIGTTGIFTTFDEAGHQFVFRYIQVKHNAYSLISFSKHFLQSLCLCNRTGETVEDYTFAVFEAVEYTCKDINHQFIRDQLTLIDITFSCFAQFCAVFDFCTQHVTG